MNNKEVEQQYFKSQKELNKSLTIENFKFIAIGYLDSSESFEKGQVSTNFLIKLGVLWSEGIILGSMGHHTCEFCEGKRATSSSEKILLDKENKIKYIFPEMIFHYITKHKFKPSQQFIEFVVRN